MFNPLCSDLGKECDMQHQHGESVVADPSAYHGHSYISTCFYGCTNCPRTEECDDCPEDGDADADPLDDL